MFITVLLGIILSITITTYINSVTISKEIKQTTSEKIRIIGDKSRQLVTEEVDSQIGFLKSIAIVSNIKEEIHQSNLLAAAVDHDAFFQENQNIDLAWLNEEPSANKLVQEILSNDLSQYLRELQAAYQENVEIFITDENGRVIAMTNRTTDYLQADEVWWSEAFSGHIYTSSPIFDQSSETWAVYISVPVFKEGFGGEIIGVVRGTVDFTSIFNSIFNVQFGQTGKGMFISQDGSLYQLDQDNNLIVQDSPENLFALIKETNGNKVDTININSDSSTIVAVNQIGRPGLIMGWIVISLEENEIQVLFIDAIKRNVLVALILIFFIGGLSLLLANNITLVLSKLGKDASLIAVGDYNQSFSKNLETSADPHITSLVNSFNKMKVAIQTREKTILSSEKKYRILVETMGEGLVMINPALEITYANPKICDFLGIPEKELMGKNISHFFEAEEIGDILNILQKKQWKPSYESNLITRNKGLIPVSISPQQLFNDLGEYSGILAVISDISARKNNEIGLKRRLLELKGLRQIDTAILEKSSLPEVIHTVLEQVKEHLHGDAAAIYIYDKDMQTFTFSGGYFFEEVFHSDQQIPAAIINDQFAEFNQGVFISENINQYILCDEFKSLPLNSLFITPILISDQLKGLIEITFVNQTTQTQDWRSYLDAIITQTAVGIDKIELLKNLRERNVDLIQAYDSAIMGWAKALELRDEETQGHSDRVVKLSLKLAKSFGFEGDTLDNFRKGALLHDIGKMGIPDTILLKPGPLDEDEWKIMKKHPEFAYKLLSEIPFLKDAIEIPYYHHERWNGSGYPHKLTGENIPLSARIFAVVDVWDALTNDRPYRPAWSHEKTIAYIKENSGVLFDPEIVAQFIKLIQP